MKTICTLIAVAMTAIPAAAQEYRGVTLELIVDNGEGRAQRLAVGVRDGATAGLDPEFEEAELPPQPPNEVFDARVISTPGVSQLGLGSLSDYRGYPAVSSTESYTVSYQAGAGASGVTLRWPETLPGRVTALRIDGEDVTGQTERESQFVTGQFSVEVHFDATPLQFRATPSPLVFAVNNVDPLPARTLTITPEGDPTASWTIESDVDWVDVRPASGEGAAEVTVRVNTQRMPAGSYQETLTVRSPLYPARVDVPVRMDMTVGVENRPAPAALWLGRNYPNPFNPTTTVRYALPRAMRVQLTLRNLLGKPVMRVLDNELREAGWHSMRIDASELPSGIYLYELRAGGETRSGRMVLAR
ncbi:MAG: T9SS type A sorting domain-containing protein [Bacteroidota bacterium]|nr:T9SS type A sorting domain-containing protein [Bacteroidota bacterium]